MRRYVRDGWKPQLPADEHVVSEAQGYITFRDTAAKSGDLDHCAKSSQGRP